MEQQKPTIVELDVRPHLRKKLEPFQLIMDTVKTLKDDDLFVLHATFKPTPLLGVMKMRGFVNKVEQRAKDHWVVTFINKKHKHLLQLENDSSDESESSDASAGESHAIPESSATPAEARPPKVTELDNRGLEPPQPMIRTLAALDRSEPGDQVRIHNDRVPVFLIEELQQLGCTFEVEEQADGSAKVLITKN